MVKKYLSYLYAQNLLNNKLDTISLKKTIEFFISLKFDTILIV